MATNTIDQAQELVGLGQQYHAHRIAAEGARDKLRQAVLTALAAEVPEMRVARLAGIDRTTVRKWRAQNVERG